jgi:hypothetical protein
VPHFFSIGVNAAQVFITPQQTLSPLVLLPIDPGFENIMQLCALQAVILSSSQYLLSMTVVHSNDRFAWQSPLQGVLATEKGTSWPGRHAAVRLQILATIAIAAMPSQHVMCLHTPYVL